MIGRLTVARFAAIVRNKQSRLLEPETMSSMFFKYSVPPNLCKSLWICRFLLVYEEAVRIVLPGPTLLGGGRKSLQCTQFLHSQFGVLNDKNRSIRQDVVVGFPFPSECTYVLGN